MGVRWVDATPPAPGEDHLSPILTCDVCGDRIEEKGIAVFDVDADGRRTGRFRSLHDREECRLEDATARSLPSSPLDEFLWRLWHNARFDWERAEARLGG